MTHTQRLELAMLRQLTVGESHSESGWVASSMTPILNSLVGKGYVINIRTYVRTGHMDTTLELTEAGKTYKDFLRL